MQQTLILLHSLFAVASALAISGISPGTLPNPLGEKGCDAFKCISTAIVGFVITIAYSVVVIMALWGGILFMTSGGNEKRAEAGKKTLYYAAIGFAIVLVSQGVAAIIESFFTS